MDAELIQLVKDFGGGAVALVLLWVYIDLRFLRPRLANGNDPTIKLLNAIKDEVSQIKLAVNGKLADIKHAQVSNHALVRDLHTDQKLQNQTIKDIKEDVKAIRERGRSMER